LAGKPAATTTNLGGIMLAIACRIHTELLSYSENRLTATEPFGSKQCAYLGNCADDNRQLYSRHIRCNLALPYCSGR
jgi:hypothetical protein